MSTTVLEKVLNGSSASVDNTHIPLPGVAIRTKHYNLPVVLDAKHTTLVERDGVPLHFSVGLRVTGPCNTDWLLENGYISDVPRCGVDHSGNLVTAYSGEPFAVWREDGYVFDPARWDVTRARFVQLAVSYSTADAVEAIVQASEAKGIAELEPSAYQHFLDVALPFVNGKQFTLPRLDVLDQRNYATLYRDRDAFEQFLAR